MERHIRHKHPEGTPPSENATIDRDMSLSRVTESSETMDWNNNDNQTVDEDVGMDGQTFEPLQHLEEELCYELFDNAGKCLGIV